MVPGYGARFIDHFADLYVFFRGMLRIEQSWFQDVLSAIRGSYQQRIEIKALSSCVFAWAGNGFDLSVFII